MEKAQEPDLALDDWRRAWYHEAVSDIRWAKDRAWSVLQGAVVLLAAILTASKTISGVPGVVYAFFVVVVGIVAALWLGDLSGFARKARTAVEDMQQPLGRYQPYPRPRKLDPHHHTYLSGQIAVVVAVVVVALIEILR